MNTVTQSTAAQRVVAQRELAGGVQEIVAIDTNTGVTKVLQRPMVTTNSAGKLEGWTFQAPKTLPDGRLMAYRCRPGEQFNINMDRVECVIFDGPDRYSVVPRPSTKAIFGKQNAVTWTSHGHATPTDRNTLIHAANELESWWLFGWPIRKQWCCVETDYAGKPTGLRLTDRAEPSWSPLGLTMINPSGTGQIITPTRTFDKATSPIGSKSFGWFDPHLSPDGNQVIWLDIVSVGLGVKSGLILGDIPTGSVRYLVQPTLSMQTDAMWLDNRLLLGSRYISGHWQLVMLDSVSGKDILVPNTTDCTAVHVK